MNHSKLLLFLFVLFCLCCTACTTDKDTRQVIDMNTGWAFFRGDVENGAWLMPMLRLGCLSACPISCSWKPSIVVETPFTMGWAGIATYFKMPAQARDKRVVVEFEGVMTNCEVYLNGEKITEHHGGYMGFVADITDRIDRKGTNVLAVRVSAEYDKLTPPGKPQERMDFYYYSGIYRDVRMVITDKIYITDPLQEDIVAGGGQFVTFPEVSEERQRCTWLPMCAT